MLYRPIPPAVVVAGLPAGIVCIGITAIAGKNIVEIEDNDVFVRIIGKPFVEEPVVKGPGIGRFRGVCLIVL